MTKFFVSGFEMQLSLSMNNNKNEYLFDQAQPNGDEQEYE